MAHALLGVRKHHNEMKGLPLTITAYLLSGMLFTACNDAGDATEETTDQLQENRKEMSDAKDESNKEWRAERDEAARELRALREDLVREQAKERERLADGIKDAGKRAECEARIAELTTNIERIDGSLAKVDSSNDLNWQEVKAESRKAADDTKNWFQRQAELIDKKTNADADNDGH